LGLRLLQCLLLRICRTDQCFFQIIQKRREMGGAKKPYFFSLLSELSLSKYNKSRTLNLRIVLLSTATYGLFAVLLNHFTSRLKNNKWKYTNIRVFVYRQFTTKLRSMFFFMIGASILITVAFFYT